MVLGNLKTLLGRLGEPKTVCWFFRYSLLVFMHCNLLDLTESEKDVGKYCPYFV